MLKSPRERRKKGKKDEENDKQEEKVNEESEEEKTKTRNNKLQTQRAAPELTHASKVNNISSKSLRKHISVGKEYKKSLSKSESGLQDQLHEIKERLAKVYVVQIPSDSADIEEAEIQQPQNKEIKKRDERKDNGEEEVNNEQQEKEEEEGNQKRRSKDENEMSGDVKNESVIKEEKKGRRRRRDRLRSSTITSALNRDELNDNIKNNYYNDRSLNFGNDLNKRKKSLECEDQKRSPRRKKKSQQDGKQSNNNNNNNNQVVLSTSIEEETETEINGEEISARSTTPNIYFQSTLSEGPLDWLSDMKDAWNKELQKIEFAPETPRDKTKRQPNEQSKFRQSLREKIRKMKAILDLRNFILDADDCRFISDCLMNEAIGKLIINSYGIGDEGMTYILDLLSSNSYIRHLKISSWQPTPTHIIDIDRKVEYTPISGVSVQQIANRLKQNVVQLEYLDLSKNNLSDQAITPIAHSLLLNSSLQTLKLSSNPISNVSALNISNTLRHNHTLTSLKIMNTKITASGGLCLFNSLLQNRTLRIIYIKVKNNFSTKQLNQIAHAIGVNNSLISAKIYCGNSELSQNQRKAINAALFSNFENRAARDAPKRKKSSNLDYLNNIFTTKIVNDAELSSSSPSEVTSSENDSEMMVEVMNTPMTTISKVVIDDRRNDISSSSPSSPSSSSTTSTSSYLQSNSKNNLFNYNRELTLSRDRHRGHRMVNQSSNNVSYNLDLDIIDRSATTPKSFKIQTLRNFPNVNSFSPHDLSLPPSSSEDNLSSTNHNQHSTPIVTSSSSFNNNASSNNNNTNNNSNISGGMINNSSNIIRRRGSKVKEIVRVNFSNYRLKEFKVDESLHAVTEIILNNNEIKKLSSKIGSLKVLSILYLQNNLLKSLPNEIGVAQSLQAIHLNYNVIEELPESIYTLPHLHTLSLHHNLISSISPKISTLPNLKYLNLSFNQIKILPSDFAPPNLIELYIENNQLSMLPLSIGNMKSLRSLFISSNNLNYLPIEITKLKLLEFEYNDNPYGSIPKSILTGGMISIFRYLKELENDSEVFSVVRLIVLGHKRSGRGSLISALTSKDREKINLASISTNLIARRIKQRIEGISSTSSSKDHQQLIVSDWHNEEITFRTWNFSGFDDDQVVFASHSLFTTSNSIYLLTFSLSQDGVNSIDNWIQSIASSVTVPILIVATFVDKVMEKSFVHELLENLHRKYGVKYPHILGYFAISSKTRKGVKDLKSHITQIAREKNMVGQRISSTYLLLIHQLESLKEKLSSGTPILSWTKFSNVSQRLMLENSKEVAQFLHKIGEIYYYGDLDDRLTDIVFLDPNWLISVLHSLFKAAITVRYGIIPDTVLSEVWVDIPEIFHGVLLVLFEKFDIIYKLQRQLRPIQSSNSSCCSSTPLTSTLPLPLTASPTSSLTSSLPPSTFESSSSLSTNYSSIENDTFPSLSKFSYIFPAILPIDRPIEVKNENFQSLIMNEDVRDIVRIWEFKYLPKSFFYKLMVRLFHFPSIIIHAIWANGMMILQPLTSDPITPRDDDNQHNNNNHNNTNINTKPGSGSGNGDASTTTTIVNNNNKSTNDINSLLLNKGLIEYTPSNYRLKVTVRIPVKGINPFPVLLFDTINVFIQGWFKNQLVNIYLPCIHCLRERSFDPFLFSISDCELCAARGKRYVHCRGIRPVRTDLLAPDIAMADIEHLERKEIILKNELGEGSFAKVYRAIYKHNEVAVKVIKIGEQELEGSETVNALLERFSEFRREVSLMSGLDHPNLVELKGLCLDQDTMYMVTEFLSFGDLYSFIHNPNYPIDWNLRIKIAIDIASGMNFLHTTTPPIIHRDLKSPNILMAANSIHSRIVAKVADFGLSSTLVQNVKGRDVFNPTWLAPEVMVRNAEYTEKADIYSFGIILWELLTRQNPFEEFEFPFESQLEDAIINKHLRPTIDEKTPISYAYLIRSCWDSVPQDRPTFAEILNTLITQIQPTLAPELSEIHYDSIDDPLDLDDTTIHMDDDMIDSSSGLIRSPSTRRRMKSKPIQRNIRESCDPDLKKHFSLLIDHRKLYPEHSGSVKCMVVVGDHVWVGCGDGSIAIWSLSGKTQVKLINEHGGAIHSIVIVSTNKTSSPILSPISSSSRSEDQYVWIASQDLYLTIWHPTEFTLVKKIKCSSVYAALLPVEKMVWCATVTSPNSIHIRFQSTYKTKKSFLLGDSPGGCMIEVDDKIWIGTFQAIEVYTHRGYKHCSLLGHSGMIHDLKMINNNIWSCSSDKTIRVWDKNGNSLHKLEGHGSRVFQLLHHRGLVLSASWDKTLIVWDSEKFTFRQEVQKIHGDAISALISDQKEIWSGSWDRFVCVISVVDKNDKLQSKIHLHASSLNPSSKLPRSKTRLRVVNNNHLG